LELRAVVLIQLLDLSLDLFGVFAHGSELDAPELAPADGFAAMAEEERPAVFEPDREHDQWIERDCEQQREEREDDVEQSLGGSRRERKRPRVDFFRKRFGL